MNKDTLSFKELRDINHELEIKIVSLLRDLDTYKKQATCTYQHKFSLAGLGFCSKCGWTQPDGIRVSNKPVLRGLNNGN
jgi:hypothetical protein